MYGRSSDRRSIQNSMNQTDIKYILELLTDASDCKDWEIVVETIETLKEFLDDEDLPDED
jgi:hypothetical protein